MQFFLSSKARGRKTEDPGWSCSLMGSVACFMWHQAGFQGEEGPAAELIAWWEGKSSLLEFTHPLKVFNLLWK